MHTGGLFQSASEVRAGDVTMVRVGPNESWGLVIGVIPAGSEGHKHFPHIEGLERAYPEMKHSETLLVTRTTRQDDSFQRHQGFDLVQIQGPEASPELAPVRQPKVDTTNS